MTKKEKRTVVFTVDESSSEIIDDGEPLTIGELSLIKKTVDSTLSEKIKVIAEILSDYDDTDYSSDANKE